ncbi:MAG: DNA replication complex GINS family protein [Thermoplasmata archaeon]|nr:DNA replication complex GINS family protein [Thermoplasmata archaeon]
MPDLYGKLLEWRRAEAGSRGLAKLPSDFHVLTRGYLADARKTFESELRENPGGRKGEVARQTHQRASQLARDIIESRMSKLLTSAFQATVGGSRELANALPEERDLFDRLVESMREFRRGSAPYLETAGPASSAHPEPAAGGRPVVPAPGSETLSAAGLPVAESPPVAFVRIMQSSPPLELAGETIELRAEDILTLPPEVARILVEGRVAERIQAVDPAPHAP